MAIMGQQIGKDLCDALGLPKQTIGFTLRCYSQEIVTVECEYYPEGELITRALAQYSLVRLADEAATEAKAVDFDAWMRKRTESAHAAYMARHSKGGVSYATPNLQDPHKRWSAEGWAANRAAARVRWDALCAPQD